MFRNPKLVGQIFLGGSILQDGPVKVTKDTELSVSILLNIQLGFYQTDIKLIVHNYGFK